jgi:tRNA(His) 5'-end guanylyltransferase
MPRYDDMLGDEQKHYEAVESFRKAAIGEPVIVRVDGLTFSAFTGQRTNIDGVPTAIVDKPYDDRIATAMDAGTIAVVEEMKAVIGYTQSDEATFILWDSEQPVECDGRFQKIASRAAAIFTDAFNEVARELMPEAFARGRARFDGRAHGVPTLELAARNIDWRERDARRCAVSMAAHSVFKQKALDGKSQEDRKDMLAEIGVDFDADYPERFRRGAFFRRMKYERHLTPEDLARIPVDRRPTGPVVRSSVRMLEGVPPLVLIENLVEFVFFKEEPIILDAPFAASVSL